jgi:hypothetical protein
VSIRFRKRFRPAVEQFRTELDGRERLLFDYLCGAGQLGYSLPDKGINVRRASGARDPRKRLAREFSFLRRGRYKSYRFETWARAGDRLARLLVGHLRAADLSDEQRALRVLLSYVAIGLAPDCVVPQEPLPRAAWHTVVKMFAQLFPSNVKRLDSLDHIRPQLSILRREAAAGLRIGRRASGRRAGRRGRELAVDGKFIALASKALGKKMAPAYLSRYLFYTKKGDHCWPHPDNPATPLTVLVCLSHNIPPGASGRSGFLAYWPDGSVKRYEIAPGQALAIEPGRMHAREPLRKGERVALLSIGLKAA